MKNILMTVSCAVVALPMVALPRADAQVSDDFSDLNDTAQSDVDSS